MDLTLPMKKTLQVCSMTALLCGLPLSSYANSSLGERVHFSGFASFTAAKSLEKKEIFGDSTYNIPARAEIRDYSKVGFRVNVDLQEKLGFTAQMLADGKNDFKPEFDWLFLSYAITPDLVVHVGKYVTSYFMYSDYTDISYAYHWIEAPDAVYGAQAINKTLDGAKLVWNTRMGNNWTSELSLMAGKDKVDLDSVGVEGSTLEMSRALGIAWQVEHEWLTLRASHMYTKTSANLKGTILDPSILTAAALVEGGACADIMSCLNSPLVTNNQALNDANLKKTISWKDSVGGYSGLGASVNFQHVFATAEVTYTNIENTLAIGKQQAGYLTIGTYLPKQTTLAITFYKKKNIASQDIKDALSDIQATINPSTDFGEMATIGAINYVLNNTQKRNREGITLSARWDFHNNAALKAEYMYEQQKDFINNKTLTPQAVRVGVDLAF